MTAIIFAAYAIGFVSGICVAMVVGVWIFLTSENARNWRR